jgi:hypothetical protein
MALDLEVELDSLGDLVPQTVEVKFEDKVREVVPLLPEDLSNLKLAGPNRSQDGVQHLRALHHCIAIKLAAGEKPVHICATLAVTAPTISKLQADEQFQLLVEEYRQEVVSKMVDNFELMGVATTETITAMLEKLTGDERSMIPFESLRRTLETLADRTGHSPVRRSESLQRHQHELGSATIARLKSLHTEDTTYEAEAIEGEVVPQLETGEESSEPTVSIADAFEPLAEAEVERQESSGESL